VKDQNYSDQINVDGKGKFGNTSKLKVTWFDNAPTIIKKDEKSWSLIRSSYTDAMNPQIDQKPATFEKPTLVAATEGVELFLYPRSENGEVYANSVLEMESTK
jgi:hypothetical protein